MEITPWTVYWITRLDGICVVCLIWIIVGLLVAGGCAMVGFMEDEDVPKKWARKIALSVIFPLIVGLFTPSSKEMAAIYLIPKIANSNSAKNVLEATDNATVLLKNKMAQWVTDQLKEKK